MMHLKKILGRNLTRIGHFRMAAKIALIGGLMMTFPPTLSAHPGHALGEGGWGHVFLSPYHLIFLLGMGAMCCVLGVWIQRRLVRRVVQWGGAALAGASLLLLYHHF